MQLDRTAVIDFLHARGEDAKAREAESRLPGSFDTDEERYGGVLRNFGIDPADVAKGPSEETIPEPTAGRTSPTSS